MVFLRSGSDWESRGECRDREIHRRDTDGAKPSLSINEVFIMSPRSGRTKIAQRFIAGVTSLCQSQPAKRATERYRTACGSSGLMTQFEAG